jgi:HAD superfamily hydrolase (TIGR01549 family)
MSNVPAIRAVVFDVGETLIDERRFWNGWADWLGIPRSVFWTELQEVIRRREHHRRVFEAFKPGFDIAAAQQARAAVGDEPGFREEDFYPDAVPCLTGLKRAGFKVGVAGNNTAATERFLARAGTPCDFIASSATFGVEKPSPEFFARLVERAGVESGAIAYVGDRIDNDVLPAVGAGLVGVFLRRGPWAEVQRNWPEAQHAHITIDQLAELPAAIALLTHRRP